jgi:nicotinamide mononucleotide transporter
VEQGASAVSLLSVHSVALTILGYPLSWVELAGTVTYLWSVWLMARRRMLTWPVGIVSVLLYLLLFWQIRLYSDALEQVYYLGASVYGWYRWDKGREGGETPLVVQVSPPPAIALQAALVAVGTLGLGCVMGQAHFLAPTLFPEAAAYPYLDAGTTVASFVAMALLTLKRIESWFWWIGVDVVGIGLYWVKDVRFVALLYVLLLGLAVRGFLEWQAARGRGVEDPAAASAK